MYNVVYGVRTFDIPTAVAGQLTLAFLTTLLMMVFVLVPCSLTAVLRPSQSSAEGHWEEGR